MRKHAQLLYSLTFLLKLKHCLSHLLHIGIEHNSVVYASTTVLDHILEHEQCDVDLQNKLQRDTPLHLAVKIEENGREGLREYLGGSCLDLWGVAEMRGYWMKLLMIALRYVWLIPVRRNSAATR